MYDEEMVVEKTLARMNDINNELNITLRLVKRESRLNTFIVRCNEYPTYEYIIAYEKKNPFYNNNLIVSDIEEDHTLNKLKKDLNNFILASID